MDKLQLKNEICDHIMQITSLKPNNVDSIESDLSTIYIKTKTNKIINITIIEEEEEDTHIDYEFEL